ncbi:MAG: DUF1285 domain-containing protein [Pseudomonadota bacterium]
MQKPDPGAALNALAKSVPDDGTGKKLPPVHLWDPPFCGDLDIRIGRDGLWYYLGTPIGRERLVRLFSTVLKLEDEKYFLVTPVEKIGITVEDVPFIGVQMEVEDEGQQQRLIFKTNVGDEAVAGPAHQFVFRPGAEVGEVTPYIHIRAGLEARIRRPVFYEMVDLAVDHEVDGQSFFGLWSDGEFFPIVPSGLLAEFRE